MLPVGKLEFGFLDYVNKLNLCAWYRKSLVADDSLITHCACWHSILLSSPCRWNTLTHVRGHIRDFTSERKERKLHGRIF